MKVRSKNGIKLVVILITFKLVKLVACNDFGVQFYVLLVLELASVFFLIHKRTTKGHLNY